MELEGLLCRHLEKFRESLPDLIERRAAKAAAQKFKPRTTQGSCWQRDSLSSAFANLNKSNPRSSLSQAFLRDSLEDELGGLAPKVVEDDIDSCFCNLIAEGRDQRRRILIE